MGVDKESSIIIMVLVLGFYVFLFRGDTGRSHYKRCSHCQLNED